ncbi:hypothetical protein C6N75_26410 [Streptomyces solincola]|uniref:DUF3105 domain-containing protein n=1 Tax=Streptomyces solincola TaxID=2100817 RepID=A0A2S9PPG2_9ACTN|nr:DUF3105 domain-containing protein [Streptomyces solincola]PRH76293.1 hypothetical protein C6N75_26410 [Streptomyces solincola]
MAANRSSAAADRRTRIEEMRRAEQARERRNRVITITLSTVVVAGLVGFGGYLLKQENDKQERAEAAAKAPIEDEKSWDAKKLGRNHVTKQVSYPMKPPVGGDHHQAWLNCDRNVYKEPVPEMHAVHSLEHGAVWITYSGKAAAGDVKKLEEKVGKTSYSFISPVEDQTGTIMLSAWGKQVTVDGADDPRIDAFLGKYVQGPQTPEPGAACTGGVDAKGVPGAAGGMQ